MKSLTRENFEGKRSYQIIMKGKHFPTILDKLRRINTHGKFFKVLKMW